MARILARQHTFSPTPRALLALVLLALCVVLMVVGACLVLLSDPAMLPSDDSTGTIDVIVAMGLLGFPIIGALIAWRRPEHRIGWLYLGIGVGIAIFLFCDAWATYALAAEPDTLPGVVAAAWTAEWLGAPVVFSALLWPLFLFPNGHLPGRRWRWPFRVGVASVVILALCFMVTPGELSGYPDIENPLGISGAIGTTVEVVAGLAAIAASLSVGVAAVSSIVRLRRSRGVERQQLKWFVWSGALVAVALAVALAIAFAFDAFWWSGALIVFSLLAMLAATGIAILRYQLYDIDVIINRTLVYGVLSLALAGVYSIGVVVFQQLFAGFASGSDLAVAGTTLAVAALVRPGRSRIQHVVDRRFYRHKYDAEHIIDTFSDRLRDELDLDALLAEIRHVVHDTMQPEHVSVWLRTSDQ